MLGDYHSKHVEFVKFSILHFSDCLLGVFSPSAGVIEFYMSVSFLGKYCSLEDIGLVHISWLHLGCLFSRAAEAPLVPGQWVLASLRQSGGSALTLSAIFSTFLTIVINLLDNYVFLKIVNRVLRFFKNTTKHSSATSMFFTRIARRHHHQ